MENMLVVNCCGDEQRASISMYLLENKLEKVIEGVKAAAVELNTEKIMFFLPEGSKAEGLDEFEVAYGKESLVTCNAFAIIEELKGQLPRPLVLEGAIPEYDGCVMNLTTPEEAYESTVDQKTKFVYCIKEKKSQVVEAKIGSKLSDAVKEYEDAKGILVGGLRGRFVTEDEFEELEVTEAHLFDSVTIFDEKSCMVDETMKLLEESWGASCGKCVLCREGTLQFYTILKDITEGKAKASDMDLMKEVAELVKMGAYCGFGQSNPNVLLTALELFKGEFEEHIKKKNCPAGVCGAFATYVIMPKLCIGCEDCVDECDEDAIEGKKGFIHMIDEDMCEKCGKCVDACEEGAIVKVSGPKPKLPKKLTKVGKF